MPIQIPQKLSSVIAFFSFILFLVFTVFVPTKAAAVGINDIDVSGYPADALDRICFAADRHGPNPLLHDNFGWDSISRYDLSQIMEPAPYRSCYYDFSAHETPAPEPVNITFDLHMTWGALTDTQVRNIINSNPGRAFVIGNEPDNQTQLTTTQYAQMYHDYYYQIKRIADEEDKIMKVYVAGVSQASPLRMLYVQDVLTKYQTLFGEPLPTDGWTLHNYVMPENCSYGFGSPPGFANQISIGYACFSNYSEALDMTRFKEQIIRFRQFMKDNGYQDKPLYVTEYGPLFSRYLLSDTGTYIADATNFLIKGKNADIGMPSDGNRLVQKAYWFSLNDAVTGFNLPNDYLISSLFLKGTNNAVPATVQPQGTKFKLLREQVATASPLLSVTPTPTPAINVKDLSIPNNLVTNSGWNTTTQSTNSATLIEATGRLSITTASGSGTFGSCWTHQLPNEYRGDGSTYRITAEFKSNFPENTSFIQIKLGGNENALVPPGIKTYGSGITTIDKTVNLNYTGSVIVVKFCSSGTNAAANYKATLRKLSVTKLAGPGYTVADPNVPGNMLTNTVNTLSCNYGSWCPWKRNNYSLYHFEPYGNLGISVKYDHTGAYGSCWIQWLSGGMSDGSTYRLRADVINNTFPNNKSFVAIQTYSSESYKIFYTNGANPSIDHTFTISDPVVPNLVGVKYCSWGGNAPGAYGVLDNISIIKL